MKHKTSPRLSSFMYEEESQPCRDSTAELALGEKKGNAVSREGRYGAGLSYHILVVDITTTYHLKYV